MAARRRRPSSKAAARGRSVAVSRGGGRRRPKERRRREPRQGAGVVAVGGALARGLAGVNRSSMGGLRIREEEDGEGARGGAISGVVQPWRRRELVQGWLDVCPWKREGRGELQEKERE